jgi:uncharacterized membrane protein
MMAESDELISKGRLDALTDGVFAFAMTLLVVKVDLPEDFHPTFTAELISALLGLGGTFIAYVVSFLVLATFWLGRARTKEEPEEASGGYAWSVLFHLFFVTLMPFSMIGSCHAQHVSDCLHRKASFGGDASCKNGGQFRLEDRSLAVRSCENL